VANIKPSKIKTKFKYFNTYGKYENNGNLNNQSYQQKSTAKNALLRANRDNNIHKYKKTYIEKKILSLSRYVKYRNVMYCIYKRHIKKRSTKDLQ